jgi:hypothetical protein
MFDFQPGQAEAMVRGVASAVGGDEGLTPTQASVLGAISQYIFDLDTPVDQLAPMSAEELAAALDPSSPGAPCGGWSRSRSSPTR